MVLIRFVFYLILHRQNYVYYIVIFFFFQAEDGIRDLTVTGVQTCALPISSSCWRAITGTPRSCVCCSSAARRRMRPMTLVRRRSPEQPSKETERSSRCCSITARESTRRIRRAAHRSCSPRCSIARTSSGCCSRAGPPRSGPTAAARPRSRWHGPWGRPGQRRCSRQSAARDQHDGGRGTCEPERLHRPQPLAEHHPREDHGAGRIERSERSDETEWSRSSGDEIERVGQDVERSAGNGRRQRSARNGEGNLGNARGGGERQRGGSAGDEQRPETGCTARAGEADEERAERQPRSGGEGERASARFRAGGPIVVAADQGNRSDGYDDAREAQRTWPLSEPDRDENGDGDRADCGDRGDHAHPAYPEPVIEQRYAGPAGHAGADRP